MPGVLAREMTYRNGIRPQVGDWVQFFMPYGDVSLPLPFCGGLQRGYRREEWGIVRSHDLEADRYANMLDFVLDTDGMS